MWAAAWGISSSDCSAHTPRRSASTNPHAIDQTRKRHPAQDFAADDFESPTGELGTFDLILSIDVIEHLLNPDILLDYIAARCNPKSYILLSTPERDVYRGEDNDGSPKPEHVREWNQQEFAEYVGQRFEVVSTDCYLRSASAGVRL